MQRVVDLHSKTADVGSTPATPASRMKQTLMFV